jgi:hypothetical protein
MAEGGRPCRYGVQRGITRRPHASMVSLYTAYSAQGHHLIWIDVVQVTVGKEEGFEAQGLGSLCALYRFANATSGAVKTKLRKGR